MKFRTFGFEIHTLQMSAKKGHKTQVIDFLEPKAKYVVFVCSRVERLNLARDHFRNTHNFDDVEYPEIVAIHLCPDIEVRAGNLTEDAIYLPQDWEAVKTELDRLQPEKLYSPFSQHYPCVVFKMNTTTHFGTEISSVLVDCEFGLQDAMFFKELFQEINPCFIFDELQLLQHLEFANFNVFLIMCRCDED